MRGWEFNKKIEKFGNFVKEEDVGSDVGGYACSGESHLTRGMLPPSTLDSVSGSKVI